MKQTKNKKEENLKMSNNDKLYIVNGLAGTYFGKIKSRKNREVEMEQAQLLYYWTGANSLNQLAAEGTKTPNSCKFSVLCDVVCLEVLRILPCTERAVKSLRAVTIWKKD